MSGLSPQFIMRASLARHVKEVTAENAQKTLAGEKVYPHDTAEGIRRHGESEIENLQWNVEYAERGYTAGENGILRANWHYFTRNITDILERAGYECEWGDEWAECEECNKLVRTSGDCWDWQPYYAIIGECSLVCFDCIDWREYLESIEDDAHSACFRVCNPAKYGYVRLSDPAEYENGWHPGRNDNPVEILRQLQDAGEQHIVFRIPETSQFYIKFEVWTRAPKLENVREYLIDAINAQCARPSH